MQFTTRRGSILNANLLTLKKNRGIWTQKKALQEGGICFKGQSWKQPQGLRIFLTLLTRYMK